MNIGDRIQALRKSKGISQEELADKVGVSRQAVSKWESGQSMPDLDKIIALGEYFDVTTDYILKGEKLTTSSNQKNNELASKILYISSVAFVVIGLFCAIGEWYENQTMTSVWGAMIIQAVGIASYFIGKQLSKEKPSFTVNFLNIAGVMFMPISMISGVISIMLFKQGNIAPYPCGFLQVFVFAVIYFAVCTFTFFAFKKEKTKLKWLYI